MKIDYDVAAGADNILHVYQSEHAGENQDNWGWKTEAHTHNACRHTLTGRQGLVHSLVSVDVMTH